LQLVVRADQLLDLVLDLELVLDLVMALVVLCSQFVYDEHYEYVVYMVYDQLLLEHK
jgi:hypothetical protein